MFILFYCQVFLCPKTPFFFTFMLSKYPKVIQTNFSSAVLLLCLIKFPAQKNCIKITILIHFSNQFNSRAALIQQQLQKTEQHYFPLFAVTNDYKRCPVWPYRKCSESPEVKGKKQCWKDKLWAKCLVVVRRDKFILNKCLTLYPEY